MTDRVDGDFSIVVHACGSSAHRRGRQTSGAVVMASWFANPVGSLLSRCAGRTAAEKDAVSAAIHEASVDAGYPEDDSFQKFISLEEADLRISPRYPDLRTPVDVQTRT